LSFLHLFTANPTTPLAAFVAGVVTSLHCTGMCGPLTCAAFGRSRSALTPAAYQLARFLSYSAAGGVFGFFGKRAASLFSSTPAQVLPWAFAALFLIFAFRLEKRIPQPKALASLLFRFRLAAMRPGTVAVLLGFLTPLLPCGPLYLVLGVTLLAGSFWNGALLMASFALGTIPLYFLVQSQFARLPLSPNGLQFARQALAFIAALLLISRALAGSGGLGTPVHCPL
jgi:sulfite exporter TauE/SafE